MILGELLSSPSLLTYDGFRWVFDKEKVLAIIDLVCGFGITESLRLWSVGIRRGVCIN